MAARRKTSKPVPVDEAGDAGPEPSVEPGPELDVEPVAASTEEQPKPATTDPRVCAVAGCDRPNVIHRLCGAHYASRRGDG